MSSKYVHTLFGVVILLVGAGSLAADTTGDAPPKKDAASHPAEHDASQKGTEKGLFPKSIPIPGTSVSVGFGGYVKVDFIEDFDGIGNRYEFKTNSIPIDGTAAADQGGETTIHARESRFNIDFRTSAKPKFRAFIEVDFFGDGNTLRLRHAYGEFGRVLAGQTWSTFMDLSARPLTVDFEGPDYVHFVHVGVDQLLPKERAASQRRGVGIDRDLPVHGELDRQRLGKGDRGRKRIDDPQHHDQQQDSAAVTRALLARHLEMLPLWMLHRRGLRLRVPVRNRIR